MPFIYLVGMVLFIIFSFFQVIYYSAGYLFIFLIEVFRNIEKLYRK